MSAKKENSIQNVNFRVGISEKQYRVCEPVSEWIAVLYLYNVCSAHIFLL